ncbi:DUF1365 domain-containing protein [Rhizobium sp. 18065]|uniref:DUF1365 domain-containing protein n=1 Tax=Rhizobium sp. 18065 TaxID=2681411 RepID=UPI00135C654A|nr:DUF1365 domain-containing protein [Rhizobium sp. 18065]
MTISSAIYAGHVLHVRHRPKQHKLRYSVFSLLVDLDELPLLDRSLRLFAYNRAGIYSVHDEDHGDGVVGGLRDWIEHQLGAAGVEARGIKVQMLCYPRILGYVFNPLTVYFCYHETGDLAAVLYEVSNTFKERHTYVIPVTAGGKVLRHRCAKEMYVSPFIPMDCQYSFSIQPPSDEVVINISETDVDGPLLFAGFTGRRRNLSDAGLLQVLITFPLMTLKVMGGIHWEALRLWLKGTPVYRHKAAAQPIATTIVLQKGIDKP